jgi:uncharacterized membrane protein YbhN (UPF0104 family)
VNVWESVFTQSRANAGYYDEDDLPYHTWDWPKGTWFQARLDVGRGRIKCFARFHTGLTFVVFQHLGNIRSRRNFGAIRFRIYSDYGLTAIDVAKICFLSGLTFWLGNLFVLGIGMVWHPWAASAIDLLPHAMNRLIGLGCLAGIAAYFIWLFMGDKRRELGQNGWKVVLPSARLTLLQILIGVVDLGFCALAMYLLMPAQPGIDFVSLAVVFILATLLGFASHAPGSIGVFDAAMLVALPEFGREQLVATLVVFRILYFLIPFGIAISAMGTRELWLNVMLPWQERRRLHEEPCPASATVPQPVERLKPKGNRVARG